MMRIIFLISLIFMLSLDGCSNNSNHAELNTSLDSIDYEIISTAMSELENYGSSMESHTQYDRKYLGNPKHEAYIISDSTNTEGFVRESYQDSLERFIGERFEVVNNRRYYIDNTRIKNYKTYTLKEEFDVFSLKSLYSKYPDAWAIVEFSKPVYCKEKACVYLAFIKGGKYGRGMFIWLTHEKGKWEIYNVVQGWIS